jgi:single-strand DNA-binding protein
MNICILIAEIIQEPQLRYTADNQTAITEMVVQFESHRADDPPATLKAIAWGNRAQEIYNQYKVGDRLIFEGRLSIKSFERPEGFKEKRAELVISRVHPLGTISSNTTPQSAPTQTVIPPETTNQNVVSLESRRQGGSVLPDQTSEFTRNPVPQPSVAKPISSDSGNNYPPDMPNSPPSTAQNSDLSSEPDAQDLDEIPF